MPARVIQIETSVDDFFGWAYNEGWTDGLPVIPPTQERVDAMMSTVTLPPALILAHLPPRRGPCTVEQVAANAVMAGCLPEYFPVVIAGVRAVAREGYNPYICNVSTHSVAPMLIINGPIRQEIEVNCSWSCMGPGNRANATIGRALNLVMLNIAGRIPGEVSKSTQAQPGRLTFCFGEYEENSPWEPLHVEHGFKPEESTVSVHGANGTINVLDMDSQTGEEILRTMAGSMMVLGGNSVFPGYGSHNIVITWCPAHAKVIAETFTKQQAKEYLVEATSRIPISWQTQRRLKTITPSRTEGRSRATTCVCCPTPTSWSS